MGMSRMVQLLPLDRGLMKLLPLQRHQRGQQRNSKVCFVGDTRKGDVLVNQKMM